MANRRFGKLSDVWKHAALAEALERVAAAEVRGDARGIGCQLRPWLATKQNSLCPFRSPGAN